MSERLAKRVAQDFGCSRSEAQAYIEGGFVSVDGLVCEEVGLRILPTQVLTLAADAHCQELPAASFLWHKPSELAAVQCGPLLADAAARTYLQAEFQQADSQPLGRQFLRRDLTKLEVCSELPQGASGLVVLTQDWHISRKLRDDALTMEQEWVVEVEGLIEPELRVDYLEKLLQANASTAFTINGLKLSWQNERRLRMVYKGGLRGEYAGRVAQILQTLGWQIKAMRRIRIGRIAMAGIEIGNWRYLNSMERF